MNYYDHNAKTTSWDVIEFNPIEVTERKLTDEEIKQWTQTIETRYLELGSISLAASSRGRCSSRSS